MILIFRLLFIARRFYKLSISDGATLSGRTRSAAPGNIIVNANTINLSGGGQILTAAFDEGDAGKITLIVADRINISGSNLTFSTRREQVIEIVNDQTNLTFTTP